MACPKCGKETLADWILCPDCTKKKVAQSSTPSSSPISSAPPTSSTPPSSPISSAPPTSSTPSSSPISSAPPTSFSTSSSQICPTCHRPMQQDYTAKRRKKSKIPKLIPLAVIIIGALIYFQIGIYTIQPMSDVPDGATFIVWRGNDEPFFNSPTNAAGKKLGPNMDVINRPKNGIIAKLPYIDFLYSISLASK